jgi:hypothetical protein
MTIDEKDRANEIAAELRAVAILLGNSFDGDALNDGLAGLLSRWAAEVEHLADTGREVGDA